jgi:hypoxanthine phosphoribosyltransferase
MNDSNPKSLTIVTLLLKPDVVKLDFPIDIVGFEIAPEFVVGYGLDYDQKMRHLPAIYRLEKE